MPPLPDASSEIAALREAIASRSAELQEKVPGYRVLLQRCRRLATLLSAPVRVAVIGASGSGKSSLTSFLASRPYIAPTLADGTGLPLILRHGPREEARACWWSGVAIPIQIDDLQSGMVHAPDFIELRMNTEALSFLSFLDMPIRPGQALADQVAWVSERADLVVFCVDARRGWGDDEDAAWSALPEAVRRDSIIVLTFDDLAGASVDTAAIGALSTEGKGPIGLVRIATPRAAAAAPGGRVADRNAWENAGGKVMVSQLLHAARAARARQISDARHLVTAVREARLHGLNDAARPSTGATVPAEANELRTDRHAEAGPTARQEAADLISALLEDTEAARITEDDFMLRADEVLASFTSIAKIEAVGPELMEEINEARANLEPQGSHSRSVDRVSAMILQLAQGLSAPVLDR